MPSLSSIPKIAFNEVVDQWYWFVEYLQLPSREEYWRALSDASRDVVRCGRSLWHLTYVTSRPVALLLWLVSRYAWTVARFLGEQLFAGFYVSLVKGLEQAQWGTRALWQWQAGLSRQQVLLEAAIVATILVLFLLRRHLQKQQYVKRAKRYMNQKKRKALKIYQRWVDRVSRTSLFLAMLLPHVLFAGVAACFKILFPKPITWLANETYATFLLSVVYPLFCNISLLYHYRHPKTTTTTTATTQPSESRGREKEEIPPKRRKQPFRERSVNQQEEEDVSSKSKVRISRFLKTNGMDQNKQPRSTGPSSPTSRLMSGTASTRAKAKSKTTSKTRTKPTAVQKLVNASSSQLSDESGAPTSVYDVQEEAKFWLHYWIVFAVFTGMCQFCIYIPIVGRIVTRSKFVKATLLELQLAFYLWIFGLSSALTSSAANESDFRRSYETRPLQLLVKRLHPIVVQIYDGTSGIIKEDTWKMLTEKLKSFLQLAVLVRLLSEKTQDQILHAFEHSHPIIVPAFTLVMPGFTKYGEWYIKTIVTVAVSCRKIKSSSLDVVTGRLEYWVLHLLFAGTLAWWSRLLRWIPFSTHLAFFVWWHMQTPQVAKRWYNKFEEELQAFGLLEGGGDKKIDDTLTASVIRQVIKTLPSAKDEGKEKDDDKPTEPSEPDATTTTTAANGHSGDEGEANAKASQNDSSDPKEGSLETSLPEESVPETQPNPTPRKELLESAPEPTPAEATPETTPEKDAVKNRKSDPSPQEEFVAAANDKNTDRSATDSVMDDTANEEDVPVAVRRSARIRKSRQSED